MQAFRNISISLKLPIIMAALVAVSLTVMGTIGYLDSRKALERAGEERLTAIASSRRNELRKFFDEVASDLAVQAANPVVIQGLNGFRFGWRALGEDPSGQLRKLYIEDNPHPDERRELLDTAGDSSTYSRTHKDFHRYFRNLHRAHEYRDVYLFDAEGNLVYSVNKRAEYATNILNGPFGASKLAEVVGKALESGDGGGEFLSDMAVYEAAGRAPAMFMATAVRSNEQTIGVLAYRLAVSSVDAILTSEEGLGETGESFAVGPDLVMRSNERFSDAPTILSRRIDEEPEQFALAGESGIMAERGEDGDIDIVAYLPLSDHGLNWAVIAEQEREELVAAATSMGRGLLLQGLIAMTVIGAAIVLLARSVSGPLNRVREVMGVVASGDYEAEIPDTRRRDEIGGISKTLEAFRDSLAQARADSADAAFKGAALEASTAALMMLGPDGRIPYINDSARALFGKYSGEIGKQVPGFDLDAIVGSDIDIFHTDANYVRRILNDPDKLPYSAPIKFGDAHFVIEINAVRDDSGKQIGCVAEWIDVTESQMNDAILAAIDNHQAKAEFGTDGRLVEANERFAALAQRSPGALAGADGGELVSGEPVEGEEPAAVWENALESGSVFGTFRVARADGSAGLLEGSLSTVRDRSGNPIRLLLIGNDVTEARRRLDAAEADRVALEQAQSDVVRALGIGLDALSNGDLTVAIEEPFAAEHEQLRHDFNNAADKLREAMAGIVANADSIRGEAEDISSAADDLSRRTERQAATLEETAAALDELTASVQSAAQGASQADTVVGNARKSAEASSTVVAEAVAAMEMIENSSEEISKIISMIEDIAFQTNLLALNAGVEAARAGEAGRGFAVVASEVRALAQRSSDAARDIGQLISGSGQHVKRGVDLVGQAGKALEQIISSVADISGHVSEIAVSAKEQSSGLAEINTSVNELDQVTQQNAAMFEQTTAASHSLTNEAAKLTETTRRFRTGEPAESPAFQSRRAHDETADTPALRAVGAEPGEVQDAVAEWEEF